MPCSLCGESSHNARSCPQRRGTPPGPTGLVAVVEGRQNLTVGACQVNPHSGPDLSIVRDLAGALAARLAVVRADLAALAGMVGTHEDRVALGQADAALRYAERETRRLSE